MVIGLGVGSLEVGLLTPRPGTAHKDVGGTGARSTIVVLVSIDPRCTAGLIGGSDYHGVTRCGQQDAKAVAKPTRLGVGSFEVSLLAPYPGTAREDVSCAGAKRAVVALVAIDPRGIAVLQIRPDHDRVT